MSPSRAPRRSIALTSEASANWKPPCRDRPRFSSCGSLAVFWCLAVLDFWWTRHFGFFFCSLSSNCGVARSGARPVIALVTMDRWVKVLPVFLAYGVLNGLFMVATGHLVNDSSKGIPRGTAVALTLLGVGSALFGATLRSRRLTKVDRVALSAVVVSLVGGLVNERFTLWSFGLMFCSLAIAWWADRYDRAVRGQRRQAR
jgi:hypothetical protein